MQTTQILPPSVQYVVSAVQWTNISTSTGSFPVENFAGNTNLLLFDRYVYTMHRYIGCIACRLFSGDPYGLPVSWQAVGLMKTLEQIKEVRKGKERKSIYMAPFRTKVHTKHSGMDHTVLPANNIVPAFPSWAFTRWHHHNNWGSRHPIAAYYSFIDPEKWKAWLAWLVDL